LRTFLAWDWSDWQIGLWLRALGGGMQVIAARGPRRWRHECERQHPGENCGALGDRETTGNGHLSAIRIEATGRSLSNRDTKAICGSCQATAAPRGCSATFGFGKLVPDGRSGGIADAPDSKDS